jgi:hypothetical protein
MLLSIPEGAALLNMWMGTEEGFERLERTSEEVFGIWKDLRRGVVECYDRRAYSV